MPPAEGGWPLGTLMPLAGEQAGLSYGTQAPLPHWGVIGWLILPGSFPV